MFTKEEIIKNIKELGVAHCEKKYRKFKQYIFDTFWNFSVPPLTLNEVFYIMFYDNVNPICDNGNKKNFKSFNTGYVGNSCSLRKQGKCLCLEKSNDLRKETNKKKYGKDHPLKLEKYKKKQRETNKKKYGVENVSQSKEIQIKKEKTWIKKYGVSHPSSSIVTKEKTKNTLLSRYGYKSTWEIPEVKEKTKHTLLNRYGTLNPNSITYIKNKIKETNRKKYGVGCVFQNKNIKNKIKETNLDKYGVYNISLKHLPKNVINIISNKDNFIQYATNKSPMEITRDLGIHNTTTYKLIKKYDISDIINWNISSICQQEIENYLKENTKYNIISNDRKSIKPKEIDIMISDINLGIEYNGLYWHSNKFIQPQYHLEKYLLAKENNITLIQIFEDEYLNSKDKAIKLLNRYISKETKEITSIDVIEDCTTILSFINDNSFSYIEPYDTVIGLYNDDVLICLISFSKNGPIEIIEKIDIKIDNLLIKLKNIFNVDYLTIKYDNRFPLITNLEILEEFIIPPIKYYTNYIERFDNYDAELEEIYDAGYTIILI